MRGLLLIHLGTPDAPTTGAVRRYLREFLSDERVLDMHPVARFVLLNVFILPLRPRRSAAAYRRIWTERGSPLRFHAQDLAAEVRKRLAHEWQVESAMRYGEPSIGDALASFRDSGVDEISVLPLFPHHASASTGSALEAVYRQAGIEWNVAELCAIGPFHNTPEFLDAAAEVAGSKLESASPDHVLFSFHGLPERQIRQSDESGNRCLERDDCCSRLRADNRHCYRAQCSQTARALAGKLRLRDGAWSLSFQSRLGRTPWIGPHTDAVIAELAASGVRRIAVWCPGFVADCLETLEEIGMRARAAFLQAGGNEFTLVPALNSSAAWADAVAAIVRSRSPSGGRDYHRGSAASATARRSEGQIDQHRQAE